MSAHSSDQHIFGAEGSVGEATGQVPLQTSVEFRRTYDAQIHEIVDAIAAMVTNAQAGLNWLCAQPPDPEGVRQTLSSVVNGGKRACEMVVRLRALMNEDAYGE
jgi:hypothetical protein